MSAPAEFRSVVGSLPTNVPGIELGGAVPRMARVADKMAFVRSFAHTNSGHGGGTHWVMTGYNFPPADNNSGQVKPGFGSILFRVIAGRPIPPPACQPMHGWAASTATARPGLALRMHPSTPAARPGKT